MAPGPTRLAAYPLALALSAVLAGCGSPPAPWQEGSGVPAAAPPAPAGAPAATPSATRRPVTRPPAARKSQSKRKPAPTPTRAARPVGDWRYVFPVSAANVSYHPTHAAYPATDLFAACGAPVVAVTDGTVLEVSRVDRFVKGRPDGPFNGGLFTSVLGDDGVRYYGSHLTTVNTGIEAGVRVRAGQRLGTVGHTGNASNVCHLHFAISPPCARTGDWNVRRGVVWPAPYLDSWRRQGSRSPVDEVAAWQRRHNCRP
jgi:murein DD-endopeptidase MepM/ murein hydrolase activator NlpD